MINSVHDDKVNDPMHYVGIFLREGLKSMVINWIVEELPIYFEDFLMLRLRATQLVKKLLEYILGSKLFFIKEDLEKKLAQHVRWGVSSDENFDELDIYFQRNFGIPVERLYI
jgi:hypothetical protein